MAIYKYVSVKPIIARIFRNTGKNIVAEYIDDILEWIPEGIAKMNTRYTLKPVALVVPIVGHVGVIPCDLVHLVAVEHEGRRLREGGEIRGYSRDTSTCESSTAPPSSIGETSLYGLDTESNLEYVEKLQGQDLKRSSGGRTTDIAYKLMPGFIQTSLEEGELTIHYKALPLDCEGYPTIPDNENYKTALYWYVLSMMIGSGYKHKVFQYGDCEQRWEQFARRALNEIKYPTADGMERLYRAGTRLVPPEHFYEDFREGSEQIQDIVK